jgi:hypothetical protein
LYRKTIIPPPTVGRRRWLETGGAALARCTRSRDGYRILEEAVEHGHRVSQGLSIRIVQAGQLWLDRTGAIGPDPVKGL